MVFIYGLLCPIDEAIRYIGKSVMPEKRFIAHLSGARRQTYDHHTARWIRKLEADNLRPSLVILEELADGADWRSAERGWITRAQKAGWPLTNSTAGGEGLDYLDPEEKARYQVNHRAAMKAYAQTEEGRRGILRMKEASMQPEANANRSAALKEAWADPQKRGNMTAAIERMRVDPTVRQKKAASLRAHWEANRDEIIEKIWTPETRAKQSEGRKASWANPEMRERMMNRWNSEAREKQAHALRERQAKIQAGRTAEVRAKQAAALKANWAARKAAKMAQTA